MHPAGAAYMRTSLASQVPRPFGGALFLMMRSHFGRQLRARGIARHAPDVIADAGRADLDALSAALENRDFVLADRPTLADVSIFGLLGPVMYWPMDTPVALHARSTPNLKMYCDRMRERCFRQKSSSQPRT
jgi:glutathione S-transferase